LIIKLSTRNIKKCFCNFNRCNSTLSRFSN